MLQARGLLIFSVQCPSNRYGDLKTIHTSNERDRDRDRERERELVAVC